MRIINFELLKNPVNWITVIAMLTIAAIAGHLAAQWFGFGPASQQQSSSHLPIAGTVPASTRAACY